MATNFIFPNWKTPYAISADCIGEIMSIYAQALGSGFITLAPVLKRLHGSWECRNLAGVLKVNIGKRPLAKMLLWLCRLPRAQTAMPTQLRVVPFRNGERWLRYFGRREFFTYQRSGLSGAAKDATAEGGEIRERFGPVTVDLRVSVQGESLRVRSTGTRLFGLKLPRWLSVGVVALEMPRDEISFYCDIRLSMPCAGTLLRYHGTLSFQDSRSG